MNRSLHLGLLGLAIAMMSAACNRHVVIEPELVGTRNQADWTVESVPAPPPREPGSTVPSVGQSPPVVPMPPQTPP